MKEKDEYISALIRVNHAGEYGAKRIYEGQLKYIKEVEDKKLIYEMYENELEHLEYFEKEALKRRVGPTIFIGIWDKLAYCLGAFSAFCGKNTAMACTSAVEEVIEVHYQEQIDKLPEFQEDELLKKVQKFKDEEVHHKEIAETYLCTPSIFQQAFISFVKFSTSLAIRLSKKY